MATMALGLPRTRDRTAEDPLGGAAPRPTTARSSAWPPLLLGDIGRSEEVVQDAFVRLHSRLGGLRRVDAAPAYLRSAVLNGARSQLRRQHVRDRHAARPAARDRGTIGGGDGTRSTASTTG